MGWGIVFFQNKGEEDGVEMVGKDFKKEIGVRIGSNRLVLGDARLGHVYYVLGCMLGEHVILLQEGYELSGSIHS